MSNSLTEDKSSGSESDSSDSGSESDSKSEAGSVASQHSGASGSRPSSRSVHSPDNGTLALVFSQV